MRSDEEFAKSQFDVYLQSKLTETSILWQDGDEPPDYYLHMDKIKYPVEVTRLVEQVETPRGQIPKTGIDASARDIAQQVQKEAIQRGILKGKYFISFPYAYRDFYDSRKKLIIQILDFIDQTQPDIRVDIADIKIEGESYCLIQKTNNLENSVAVGAFQPSSKFELEAFNEGCQLLEKVINNKAKLLSKLDQPKILLIIDQYNFVEPENYLRCISKISAVSEFHTIFLIHTWDNRGIVLHTADTLFH